MSRRLQETEFYDKALGCLIGGLIGDSMGTPTENLDYHEIEKRFGWVDSFTSDGTDDTVMKVLLSEALIRTGGAAGPDDWAAAWLENWDSIFGDKVGKFFQSVLHTASKLKNHSIPRMAALGNMPSSSSAMCISPVGIVNAGRPRAAALQAANLASLIHIHDVGFCQDGASAMAAAVAEALKPGATVASILEQATAYIPRISGAEMLDRIGAVLELARSEGDFKSFRATAYERRSEFFCRIACDSRETIPFTLGLVLLADGDLVKMVSYGANLGRDADTIASMGGAIAGALGGTATIPDDWMKTVRDVSQTSQADLAERLCQTAIARFENETAERRVFSDLMSR